MPSVPPMKFLKFYFLGISVKSIWEIRTRSEPEIIPPIMLTKLTNITNLIKRLILIRNRTPDTMKDTDFSGRSHYEYLWELVLAQKQR